MRKLALLALLCTGCMLGPNYHRPYIDAPDDYIYEPDDAHSSLDVRWWEQFGDQVLVDLIDEAVLNNYDLKAATANIYTALGIMIEVRAPLFPQLGYEGFYSRTRFGDVSFATDMPTDIGTPTNPSTTLQGVALGSWELDLWGRTRRLTESARAEIFATCQARRAVMLALVASVADNYILLRGLDEQLNIAKATRDSYHEAVVYFETQFEYGQTSQMEVAQARTQFELAESKIPQIEANIIQTENALSVLLSSNPRSIPRGKSIYDLQMPDVPDGLPSELLCQRPDVMQAEQELIARNAEIGAAKALYFPSISLTGFYGNSSQYLNNLFSGPANTWNFTGAVTGPIFTAGAISGRVLQANARQQSALFNYRQTIQTAFADVENALSNHVLLLQQSQSEMRLVAAASQYQHLATLQYNGGYAPYFIVIQAQEQLFPAQLSWAKTRAEIFSSLVNIYQAMGGGWIELATPE